MARKKSKNFLKPTRFKGALTLAFYVPSLIIILFFLLLLPYSFLGFLGSLSFFSLTLILAVPLSYLISCTVDFFIKNRNIKIAIASISGLVSIILGYVFYKAMTDFVVCDPVHIPTNGGDVPVICDPVHYREPAEYGVLCGQIIKNAGDSTSAAAQKLKECLQNF